MPVEGSPGVVAHDAGAGGAGVIHAADPRPRRPHCQACRAEKDWGELYLMWKGSVAALLCGECGARVVFDNQPSVGA